MRLAFERSATEVVAVNEAAIKKKLDELAEVISVRPSGSKKGVADGVYFPNVSTEAQPVEDSLDQLRLQVKYLIFDLEATRRENHYLRRMLENRRGPDRGGGQDGRSEF